MLLGLELSVDGELVLLHGRGLELHDEFGGYPAAVFDVDALAPGPVPDFGGVRAACAGLAAGPGRALGAWPSPPDCVAAPISPAILG